MYFERQCLASIDCLCRIIILFWLKSPDRLQTFCIMSRHNYLEENRQKWPCSLILGYLTFQNFEFIHCSVDVTVSRVVIGTAFWDTYKTLPLHFTFTDQS